MLRNPERRVPLSTPKTAATATRKQRKLRKTPGNFNLKTRRGHQREPTGARGAAHGAQRGAAPGTLLAVTGGASAELQALHPARSSVTRGRYRPAGPAREDPEAPRGGAAPTGRARTQGAHGPSLPPGPCGTVPSAPRPPLGLLQPWHPSAQKHERSSLLGLPSQVTQRRCPSLPAHGAPQDPATLLRGGRKI